MWNIKVFKDVTSCQLVYCQVHFGSTEFFRNVSRYLPVDKHQCVELGAPRDNGCLAVVTLIQCIFCFMRVLNPSQRCLSTGKYLLPFRKNSVPTK
jgi:hypothetical protein